MVLAGICPGLTAISAEVYGPRSGKQQLQVLQRRGGFRYLKAQCAWGSDNLTNRKADDAKGETEEHYLHWKTSMFDALKTDLAYEEHEPVYEPSIEVIEESSSQASELHNGEPWATSSSRKAIRTMSPNHALPIKSAKELFAEADGRNCFHMELDLSENPGLKYKTGDHLGVFPMNPTEEIERLIRCLGRLESRQNPLSITDLQSDGKLKIPTPTTLEA